MDESKSLPAGAPARSANTSPTKNIVEAVSAAGRFTTFAGAVKAAGLTGALAAKGPFTVFAPTDQAFEKLPAGAYDGILRDVGRLKAILNYHVISGYFASRDMKSGAVVTLQGSPLTVAVAESGIRVNGVPVSEADIIATNGVVHAIETVILPKNWKLRAKAA